MKLNITSRLLGALALSSVASTCAQAAIGDSATFEFNLPATAVASQTPPYPLVATLTLTEVSGGVDFLLKPNWSGAGTGFSAESYIERLDIAYKGAAAPTFSFVSGTPIASWSYESNPNNMDAGYKANDQHLVINWPNGKKDNRLDSPETSEWKFSGVLTDFTGTAATSGPKPTPIFGVISVTSYSLDNVKPTPSNWVAGVPEPASYALMCLGLAAIGVTASRSKRA